MADNLTESIGFSSGRLFEMLDRERRAAGENLPPINTARSLAEVSSDRKDAFRELSNRTTSAMVWLESRGGPEVVFAHAPDTAPAATETELAHHDTWRVSVPSEALTRLPETATAVTVVALAAVSYLISVDQPVTHRTVTSVCGISRRAWTTHRRHLKNVLWFHPNRTATWKGSLSAYGNALVPLKALSRGSWTERAATIAWQSWADANGKQQHQPRDRSYMERARIKKTVWYQILKAWRTDGTLSDNRLNLDRLQTPQAPKVPQAAPRPKSASTRTRRSPYREQVYSIQEEGDISPVTGGEPPVPPSNIHKSSSPPPDRPTKRTQNRLGTIWESFQQVEHMMLLPQLGRIAYRTSWRATIVAATAYLWSRDTIRHPKGWIRYLAEHFVANPADLEARHQFHQTLHATYHTTIADTWHCPIEDPPPTTKYVAYEDTNFPPLRPPPPPPPPPTVIDWLHDVQRANQARDLTLLADLGFRPEDLIQIKHVHHDLPQLWSTIKRIRPDLPTDGPRWSS